MEWRSWIFCILLITSGSFAQQKISNPRLLLGLENLGDDIWTRIRSDKKHSVAIGLITNHTGKNQEGKRTIDVLLQRGLNIKKIFVPEHGLEGLLAAEKEVGDSIDHRTKIPVISLYGKGTGNRVHAHHMKDLDFLIFDMQDSGMRHYTYISTLLHVMESASHHDKLLIVLDRPNPLGIRMEGPVSEKHLKSFIAAAPIPLRHGMTIGELARYFNAHVLHKKVKLHVVSMHNYNRTAGFASIPYTPLSPNIPTKASCYGYSFLGVLGEVRPCDIGLNTKYAMQCIALAKSVGVSDVQWRQLSVALKKHGVDTVPCSFYSPRKKETCNGLQLKIQNINLVASFQVVLTILKFLHDRNVPIEFSQYFDLAVGSKKVREYIKGSVSYAALQKETNAQLEQFLKHAQPVFLYKPMPSLASLKIQ